MKQLIVLLLAALLAGCAYPKTIPEFRKLAKESSWGNRLEFDLKPEVTLAQVRQRMEKYADKCFRGMEAISTTSRTGPQNFGGGMMSYGSPPSTTRAYYDPSIHEEGSRTSLTIKRRDSSTDYFIVLADVEKKPGTASLHGIVYYPMRVPGSPYGEIGSNTSNWLQDIKKLCPEVK